MVGILVGKILEGQETNHIAGQRLFDLIGGQTGCVDVAIHADEAGQADLQRDDGIIQAHGQLQLFAVAIHGQHIGHIGDAQIFGHLRAHLGSIAVGGLLAAEDQVVLTALADALGQSVGGGQHIGAGEFPVRQDGAASNAHTHGLFNDSLGLGRAHGNGIHRAAKTLCQRQCHFDGVKIVGVDLAGHAAALQHTGNGIHLHIVGAGNLLDANQNLHEHILHYVD